MTGYLWRRYRLSASHRLFCPELSDAENAALFGKCANPHGHGHNYGIEVCIRGAIDPTTGMVCDLAALDACVEAHVVTEYDHANLNLHEDFSGLVPTTENFCMAIHARLVKSLRDMDLVEVRVLETARNSFVYAGGGLPLEARQGAAVSARREGRSGRA